MAAEGLYRDDRLAPAQLLGMCGAGAVGGVLGVADGRHVGGNMTERLARRSEAQGLSARIAMVLHGPGGRPWRSLGVTGVCRKRAVESEGRLVSICASR